MAILRLPNFSKIDRTFHQNYTAELRIPFRFRDFLLTAFTYKPESRSESDRDFAKPVQNLIGILPNPRNPVQILKKIVMRLRLNDRYFAATRRVNGGLRPGHSEGVIPGDIELFECAPRVIFCRNGTFRAQTPPVLNSGEPISRSMRPVGGPITAQTWQSATCAPRTHQGGREAAPSCRDSLRICPDV